MSTVSTEKHPETPTSRSCDPRISVVIPCFNAAQTLTSAVQSVLAQGEERTQLILVDDCSTDETVDIARSLACDDQRIELVQQPENRGPGTARNAGLRIARGEYICFLDSDDEYLPGFFSEVLDLLDRREHIAGIISEVQLVGCDLDVHPVQMNAIVRSLPTNLILRRAVAELIGGFPEDQIFRGRSAGEDIAFRDALHRHFHLQLVQHPYLRYSVEANSHLVHFLNTTQVKDDRLQFAGPSDPENNDDILKALRIYHRDIDRRMAVIGTIRDTQATLPINLRTAVEFEALRQQCRRHSGVA